MNAIPFLDRLDSFAPALIDAAERGAVAFLAALIVTSLMGRRTASARHLVWVGAIAVQLVLPLFALWGPRLYVAVPDAVAKAMLTVPEDASVAAFAAPRPRVPRHAQPTPRVSEVPSQISAPTAPAPQLSPITPPRDGIRVTWAELAFGIWSLGALFVLVRLATGTAIVARLARAGRPVDDGAWLALAQRIGAGMGIRRPLTLLKGNTVSVPVTWGVLFPIVLLPDDSDSWPEERRQFVLVHELAHVKRLDALTQLMGQLALALFWFDPLAWVANRRMQLEREHACDDYVLRHGTAASLYAEELLAMVRLLGASDHRSQPSFAALAMARRSEFEGRMLSILDPVLDRHPLSTRRAIMNAAAALLLVVPLAALHPYHRSPAPESPARHAEPTLAPAPRSYPDSTPLVTTHAADTGRTPVPQQVKSLTIPFTFRMDSTRNVAMAASTPAPPAASVYEATSCDGLSFGGSPQPGDRRAHPSLSVHSDDDGRGNASMEILIVTTDRCVGASVMGTMTYNTGETDVIAAPPGATALFRERTASDDRQVLMAASSDGSISHTYTHNGQPAPYDADAHAWLARFLPTMLEEASVNVRPRVARWIASGGVDAVLTNISAMHGTSAKRDHYQALINAHVLTAGQADIVAEHAARNLRSAAYDLSSVLVRLAPDTRKDARIAAALEPALSQLQSDHDKSIILEAYGDSHDRDMLLMVARASRGISNDGDKSRLLISLSPNILGPNDRDLNAEFIRSATTISSSGDLSRALHAAVQYAPSSEDLTRGLIEIARGVSQSGDRARVLISLASSGALKTDALRDSFATAAREIPDEAERSRVLQAASRR